MIPILTAQTEAGACGYVDECNPMELARAVKAVHQGSIWAPRRVLSAFVERASAASLHRIAPSLPPGKASAGNACDWNVE